MYASFFLNLIKGMNGTLNISLSGPSGIAAEPAFQTLFIADTDNHRVITVAIQQRTSLLAEIV